ncbi:MAG: HupE/UreJ family protein [Alphaproteobacteria bacterium]
MSSQRFILFSVAIFLVGAMPFLIAQPSAAASAGLSLGFSAPLEHVAVMVVLMLAGIACALLPRDGLMLIPLAFVMMIMVGGMLMLDLTQFHFIRQFVLGAILCMGLLVGITRHKFTVLTLLVIGSLGFHLGGFYLAHVRPSRRRCITCSACCCR